MSSFDSFLPYNTAQTKTADDLSAGPLPTVGLLDRLFPHPSLVSIQVSLNGLPVFRFSDARRV